MIRHIVSIAKILSLVAPQLAFSTVAILIFIRTFDLPRTLWWFHMATLLPLQCVFFWTWSAVGQRNNNAEKVWFRRFYVISLFLKSAAINLFFVGSYVSYQLWGAYVSRANLSVLIPHVEGFYLAVGSASLAAAGLLLLALAAYFYWLFKLAPRLVRWLQWSFAAPASSPAVAGLTVAAILVAAGMWHLNLDPAGTRRQDPVLCFWTNAAAGKPLMTPEMIADVEVESAYQIPTSFRRRNVIIITIDCMRSDHLSFRGYKRETMPFLARLAASGRLHQVDFAVSNGNESKQGILSALGSRYPHNHNLYNFKLPDLLKRAGYRTHVFGTGDHSTLGDMRQFYGPNIDVFSDGLSPRTFSVNDDRGLLESLRELAPSDGRPAFFFIHLMSPHSLAVKQEEFARWQPALLQLDWGRMILGGMSPDVGKNTYDNGLYQADHYLREILEQLAAKGYLQDYVGAIAGDHGEGMGERGNFGHTQYLFMEDIKIPILFLDSEQTDYGPMPFGSLVDIGPTILDRLGLPAPPRWNGHSLFRSSGPDRIFAVGKRDGEWRAVIRRKNGQLHKYLFFGKDRRNFRELLFNLSTDPFELHDLIGMGQSDLLTEMRQLAQAEFNFALPPNPRAIPAPLNDQ